MNFKEKWKTDLDSIHNIMVFYIIERTLSNLFIDNNEVIDINIYIDQRKVVPNIYNKNGVKLESLEAFIKTTWFLNQKFINSNLQVVQLNSLNNLLIHYSDYCAGLVNSMCRFVNSGINYEWDKNTDLIFFIFHKKIKCKCYYTIKKPMWYCKWFIKNMYAIWFLIFISIKCILQKNWKLNVDNN
ncbi:hypothetical protein [Spiroplasma taiwanense]|uniref:Uncharacterized protein n=1 Tax=Spiroplasma taiwanense CT-1 TaxID=1276220 RepID=S5LXM0_9MOLU|nr:hypothetical protein [Spiroplasma taiwanense]AGR41361.1 hypothetical protein STAIW_v1c07570 [Spiroplasma taiwanense CT-1]